MPAFSDTTPFYLKVSIACAGIAGCILSSPVCEVGGDGGGNSSQWVPHDMVCTSTWRGWMESMRPIAITLTTGMRGWSSVCLPMLIVIMTCVSGMAPGAFQSRGLRCNMVDLIGYCTLCMQACLCIPLRGLPAGSSQQYIPLMSTIAMHCSVHAVHTSMSVHRESCKGMRQCTRASADIFPPVGWFCIAVLHVVCVGMPVSWGQTPQDALLTHALSAFAPEGIGSVWCIWSSLLFRLLDTGGEVDE